MYVYRWCECTYVCVCVHVDSGHAEIAHIARSLKGCERVVDEGPRGRLNYVPWIQANSSLTSIRGSRWRYVPSSSTIWLFTWFANVKPRSNEHDLQHIHTVCPGILLILQTHESEREYIEKSNYKTHYFAFRVNLSELINSEKYRIIFFYKNNKIVDLL